MILYFIVSTLLASFAGVQLWVYLYDPSEQKLAWPKFGSPFKSHIKVPKSGASVTLIFLGSLGLLKTSLANIPSESIPFATFPLTIVSPPSLTASASLQGISSLLTTGATFWIIIVTVHSSPAAGGQLGSAPSSPILYLKVVELTTAPTLGFILWV